MNKLKIIIAREYLTRVRKKSFIIMTILGPIFIAAIIIVPVYLAKISVETQKIALVDETGVFLEALSKNQTEQINFEPRWDDLLTVRSEYDEKNYNAILYIPERAISSPSLIQIYSKKQVGINVTTFIENVLQKEIEGQKLALSGIDRSVLENIKTPVKINSIIFSDDGKEQYSFTEISMVLGLIAGILIYMFIFMFGSQVMRGVIEEKTSRIIEIIVSSVSPFEIMMGKIVGIALVGLTQFALWVVLSFLIIAGFQLSQPETFTYKEPTPVQLQNKGLTPDEAEALRYSEMIASPQANRILEGIRAINFPVIILMFLFYFIGGYLLYAALFAAIGSAVDNEADTQQFMLPVTVPLIIAIVMSRFVINEPDGSIAYWLSIIPLTSPVIMMIRIPFNPPIIDVVVSVVLLIGGFIAATWLAAKIYRTGILMYGKKITYKELWKWITYSN